MTTLAREPTVLYGLIGPQGSLKRPDIHLETPYIVRYPFTSPSNNLYPKPIISERVHLAVAPMRPLQPEAIDELNAFLESLTTPQLLGKTRFSNKFNKDGYLQMGRLLLPEPISLSHRRTSQDLQQAQPNVTPVENRETIRRIRKRGILRVIDLGVFTNPQIAKLYIQAWNGQLDRDLQTMDPPQRYFVVRLKEGFPVRADFVKKLVG